MRSVRRPSRPAFAALLLLALSALTPSPLHALELRRSVRLGAPPRAATVRVDSGEAGLNVEVRGAGGTVRGVIPAGAGATVELEPLTLAGGAQLLILRAKEGEAEWVWVVGARGTKPELLFAERVDLVGERGERRGYRVELEDRTGDGQPDLIVGELREDTYLCGQPPALLSPRAVHPGSLSLRSVTLRRLGEAPGNERTVIPSDSSPGPEGEPLLDALHFRRASSIAGAARGALVPAGISDGDTATAWVEGAGSGADEFVTAVWSGGPGLPIRALSVVVRPTGAAGEATQAPRALLLVGDEGPRIRVPLPADLAPGQRLWIVPPRPLAAGCLSVVLDVADDAPEGHTAIAELRAYSEVDFGGGLGFLMAELAAGGARAGRAERLLGGAGARAVDAIAAAWPDLPSAERARATRILGRLSRSEPTALELLAEAAVTSDEELARTARRALVERGIPGLEALAEVAVRDESGAALLELSRRSPRLATGPLLAALGADGGEARPALRQALAACLRSPDPAVAAAVSARLEQPVTALFAAALLEAAADAGSDGRALAERSLARVLEEDAPSFDVRFRVARAAPWETLGEGESQRALIAFLKAQAAGAEEWMMRREALLALSAPSAPAAAEEPTRLRKALTDPYPRVRLAAVEALAPSLSEPDAVEVAKLARRDAFPLVRAGAVRALAPVAAARPVLRAALSDPAERVRVTAIEVFTALGERDVWGEVEATLRRDDERPVVTEAAIGYARALCVEAAVPALAEVVGRGQRPGAWEPLRVAGALAIVALGDIGSPAARAALEAASQTQGQLTREAARALTQPAACPR